ncbi:hypothetical protein B0A49_08365 [Cryomyces minteri]|uniref:Uncharacterized protein n=1 Tax=Cryomyces minteri TaxID=331657 RepID=A0A4U0WZI5_9PEZI|nr:hypothetical protein B0A49_08365 [Cryomyces minteri]
MIPSVNECLRSQQQPVSAKDGVTDRTRLHITPFNPTLLKAIIPPSILPLASNISYHTVQTFSEQGYGFAEVPTMDGQKLKKKLNGSILKGTKIKIEEARPEKRKATEAAIEADSGNEPTQERSAKRAKKEKRKEGVLPAVELPNGRKVKRGWTEPVTHVKSAHKKKDTNKDKQKGREHSKYTRDAELLFKTILPPNVAAANPDNKTKIERKEKKSRRDGRETTVHEFSKTVKHPSFLKDNQVKKSKVVSEYVHGKGWVDEEGSVVESESVLRLRRNQPKPKPKTKTHNTASSEDAPNPLLDEATSEKEATSEHGEGQSPALSVTKADVDKDHAAPPSGQESTSSDANISEIESMSKRHSVSDNTAILVRELLSDDDNGNSHDRDDTSDDGVSSVVSSESSVVSESNEDGDNEPDSAQDDDERPEESAKTPNATSTAAEQRAASDTTSVPEALNAHTSRTIHPLEALYKRAKPDSNHGTPKPAPIQTSFSFFDSDVQDDDTAGSPPQTPFAHQDLRYRSLRSAAPNPDTAAIRRSFSVPWATKALEEQDVEDEEMANLDFGATTPVDKPTPNIAVPQESGEKPESDFAKWFWEHRGDTNRAWKKRRREAMKQKRQRENRSFGRRAV